MRRFLLPVIAGVAFAVAGCATETPEPAGTSASSLAPEQASGDDAKACETLKKARTNALEPMLRASVTLADKDATSEELTAAAKSIKDGFTKLQADVTTAASQAQTPKLKEGLNKFSAATGEVIKNVEAAGTDPAKLQDASDISSFNTAEKDVMAICA
jgi:hypothetical protein